MEFLPELFSFVGLPEGAQAEVLFQIISIGDCLAMSGGVKSFNTVVVPET